MPLLDWVNRNQAEETATQVPYHLLKFKQAYGDEEQAKENLIIHGDNLHALKALLPTHTGQIKCIYIDPPFNTQEAFDHYDDKLEHAQWLSMLYPRLQLLKELSVHDKFHRTLILSGFCLLKIAKISLNSSFFPNPIKR